MLIQVMRVDFLSDGHIMPLSFIDQTRKSHYIKKLISVRDDAYETKFKCLLSDNKSIEITYSKTKSKENWSVQF